MIPCDVAACRKNCKRTVLGSQSVLNLPRTDPNYPRDYGAFVNTWISRFGTPQRLTCDRGGQFESGLFETLSKLLGVHLTRTASYTPQCNGMVERLHRPLKQALTCHQADWLDALPLVLLGIRTVLREDLNASAAELVYGSSLRLPGQLYEEKRIDQCPDYVARLQRLFRAVSPTFPLRHEPRQARLNETASHFVLPSYIMLPEISSVVTGAESGVATVCRLPLECVNQSPCFSVRQGINSEHWSCRSQLPLVCNFSA
ncbi:hypothetical protein AVEN_249290-1 [Araneus ventricosus]|uniref:Integrase catalytic domain-containing protein n=1 Tax=Araneus ventricosus TaxID=182803 RepID=A0A4Y2WK60_ARAVE|nr:hypothetical protein AVEN_249290-1 [Araneus ventricosus]